MSYGYDRSPEPFRGAAVPALYTGGTHPAWAERWAAEPQHGVSRTVLVLTALTGLITGGTVVALLTGTDQQIVTALAERAGIIEQAPASSAPADAEAITAALLERAQTAIQAAATSAPAPEPAPVMAPAPAEPSSAHPVVEAPVLPPVDVISVGEGSQERLLPVRSAAPAVAQSTTTTTVSRLQEGRSGLDEDMMVTAYAATSGATPIPVAVPKDEPPAAETPPAQAEAPEVEKPAVEKPAAAAAAPARAAKPAASEPAVTGSASAKAREDDVFAKPDMPGVVETVSNGGAAAAATGTARITTHVNMRSAPRSGASVVSVLAQGRMVELVKCTSWCEVVADGKRGFVYKSYIDTRATRRS